MSVPGRVREEVRGRLWQLADSLDWAHLSLSDKSKYYEEWTQAQSIGAVLARYIDKGRVRVYLKDTLLKDYARTRQADDTRPLRVLGIDETTAVVERYAKPHGRRLGDGRVICWGRAEDWRGIVTAVFERAFLVPGASAFAIVLFNSTGRWDEPLVHTMVETAADRLGITRVVWLIA